jgi:hypothetical protein
MELGEVVGVWVVEPLEDPVPGAPEDEAAAEAQDGERVREPVSACS